MIPFDFARVRRCAAAIATLVATAGAAGLASSSASPAGLQPLDYAFRFASAIANDPKDRATAQELALAELLDAGALEEVAKRVESVEGWRRGVVHADLASALARKGRSEEARTQIRKAEEVRATVSGWQNPRISAHVAQALAALGEDDRARELAAGLAAADPVQYAGRSVAIEAAALAARGDAERAMERLASIQGNDDPETAWWRTSGYLNLGRQGSLARKTRFAALDAARASLERLPAGKRVEAQLSLIEEYSILGRRGDGRKVATAAAAGVEAIALQHSERIPLLIGLGRAWAQLGDARRSVAALTEAETLVDRALSIDRPGLLARIASGYRQIPDGVRARRLDDRALAAAEAMPLARPRALSVAAICRQLGRDRVVLEDSLRSRLDALLDGLGDPW